MKKPFLVLTATLLSFSLLGLSACGNSQANLSGEKKEESRKTHPCLIEDWEMVIGEKFDICHPEYDLLSIFTLFQEER